METFARTASRDVRPSREPVTHGHVPPDREARPQLALEPGAALDAVRVPDYHAVMQLAGAMSYRWSLVIGGIALAALACSLRPKPLAAMTSDPSSRRAGAADACSAFELADGAERQLRRWLIRP
jgi:hypothetical protein